MSDVIPDGSAVVTPAQMFNEIRGTHDTVNRIEGMLSTQTKQVGDHENRLRSLERKVWGVAGGATAIASLAGWLISHATAAAGH